MNGSSNLETGTTRAAHQSTMCKENIPFTLNTTSWSDARMYCQKRFGTRGPVTESLSKIFSGLIKRR